MIKFNKKNNVVPIDFGEFQLEFVANDDNLKRMEQVGNKAKETIKEVENLSDLEALDTYKQAIQEAWDALYGEGTFEKVYDFAGRSILTTSSYFFEMIDGIQKAYHSQLDVDSLSKYVKSI